VISQAPADGPIPAGLRRQADSSDGRRTRKKVDPSNQRFGNKNNSRSSLNVESIEPAQIEPVITACEPAKLATPQQDKPAPVSPAHLHVVQSKRGRYGVRKYGRSHERS
jgi:hypothetical protein